MIVSHECDDRIRGYRETLDELGLCKQAREVTRQKVRSMNAINDALGRKSCNRLAERQQ